MEKRKPSYTVVDGNADRCKHHENSMEVPKNKNKQKNTDLPYDSVILLLGMYLKKPKNINPKEYTHPCFHCSVINNSQDMEAAQVRISR